MLLVIRNEIRKRGDARNLRQGAQLRGHLIGRGQRRLQHLDVVGAAVRIVLQLKIGRDRLGLGAAQIDRIEIEPQPIEQRQSPDDNERGDNEDRDAMPGEEIIDRRQDGIAELGRFGRRLEQT